MLNDSTEPSIYKLSSRAPRFFLPGHGRIFLLIVRIWTVYTASILLASSRILSDSDHPCGYFLGFVPGTETEKSFSDIHTLGALSGNSKKSFRGTLDFLNGATASEGAEEDTCLLLDPTVKSVSLPLLLCKEDNVVGNHAASAASYHAH